MRAYLQSQQDVEPAILALLKAAKESAGITETISFTPMPDYPARNVPTLSLGPMDRQVHGDVVVAPSVAALMAKADSVTRLADALKLLAGDVALPSMDYTVCESVNVVKSYLEKLDGKGPIVLDIETSGVVDEDRPDPDRIISLALYNGTGPVYVIPEDLLNYFPLQEQLNAFIRKNFIIAHNEKFDLPYFDVDLPVEQRFDPMVAHYVLFPAGSSHGLKELCEQYFGVGDWDEALKKYTPGKTYTEAGTGEDGVWWDARTYPNGSGYERIPRTLLYEYNAYDVFYTWHLFLLLSDKLTAANKWGVFARRMGVSGLFMKVEKPGVTLDRKHLEHMKVVLEAEFKQAKEELDAIAGHPINPNSHVQVKKWFAETKGTELPRMRSVNQKTRKIEVKPSSNEKALNIVIENAKGKYDGQAIEFAHKLLELRGITKNLGTYVNGFLDRAHGDTIYMKFNVTGPMTGRLANRGAGIMTIPRDKTYRKMVVPSGPGRVLVKPDYGQLEMRLVAFFSMDERFVAAFQPGMPDFFTQMMPEVYPDIDLRTKTPDELAALRNGVKPISHGANYARGVNAIAEQLGMPLAQAQGIYDRYMGPHGEGLRAWQEEVKELARTGGDIVTPYGWHYQAEVVTEKNMNSVENSALAFMPQSTGNDICLGAAMNIQPQLGQYDSWIIATIHDQIIADVPIEHATTVGKLMETEMLEEAKRVVGDVLVFEAAPEYGFHWAEKMDQTQWDEYLEKNLN